MNEAAEREAFEAWALKRNRRHGGHIERTRAGRLYDGVGVQEEWEAWQARATIPLAIKGEEE